MINNYEVLAEGYFKTKQYTKAIEQCVSGLQLDGENTKLLYIIAKSYYCNHDISKSIPRLQEIIKLKPNEFDTNYLLGILYVQKKQFKEAIDILNRLKNTYPGKWKLHMYLAEAYLGLNDYEDALYEAKCAYENNHSIFNIYNIIRIIIYKNKVVSIIGFIISALLAYFLQTGFSLIFICLFLLFPILAALAFLSEKRFVNGILVLFYIFLFSGLYIIIH